MPNQSHNKEEAPSLKKRKLDISKMKNEILPVYGGDDAAFATYKVRTCTVCSMHLKKTTNDSCWKIRFLPTELYTCTLSAG